MAGDIAGKRIVEVSFFLPGDWTKLEWMARYIGNFVLIIPLVDFGPTNCQSLGADSPNFTVSCIIKLSAQMCSIVSAGKKIASLHAHPSLFLLAKSALHFSLCLRNQRKQNVDVSLFFYVFVFG
eukprot:GEMP01144555.1.p1 GENE.GEMP01144555.1~~GEMP01144555.1.p1  ORF type:complete len:124 (+),score=1.83 GEMP01144555.1:41-412(+)